MVKGSTIGAAQVPCCVEKPGIGPCASPFLDSGLTHEVHQEYQCIRVTYSGDDSRQNLSVGI